MFNNIGGATPFQLLVWGGGGAVLSKVLLHKSYILGALVGVAAMVAVSYMGSSDE